TVGDQMIEPHRPGLAGPVDTATALIIVPQRESQRVVNTVTSPGEVHTSTTSSNLDGNHTSRQIVGTFGLPVLKLVNPSGQFVVTATGGLYFLADDVGVVDESEEHHQGFMDRK